MRFRYTSFHVLMVVKAMQKSQLTCITHVVIKWCVCEMSTSASLVAWVRIPTAFVFGGGVGVSTQVSSFHWGLSFQTCIIARIDLRYASEHVVQTKAMPDLMDHGVRVTKRSVKGRIQHDSTWKSKETAVHDGSTDSGVPRTWDNT